MGMNHLLTTCRKRAVPAIAFVLSGFAAVASAAAAQAPDFNDFAPSRTTLSMGAWGLERGGRSRSFPADAEVVILTMAMGAASSPGAQAARRLGSQRPIR
jgi:hypothetical protein